MLLASTLNGLLLAQVVSQHLQLVSASDAKALVSAALPPSIKRLPGVGIEPGQVRGRFDYFTVTWAQPGPGSVVAGNYAVDLRTGDVFSSVIECDELKTSALRQLQHKVRAQLGLSRRQYRELKSTGPLCEQ